MSTTFLLNSYSTVSHLLLCLLQQCVCIGIISLVYEDWSDLTRARVCVIGNCKLSSVSFLHKLLPRGPVQHRMLCAF